MFKYLNGLLALALISLSGIKSEAQLNKWLICGSTGNLYEIDFSTPIPTSTWVASPGTGNGGDEDINLMTDADGNVLFSLLANSFTNIKVMDKNYAAMPNGNDLKGCNSSIQSNIIPRPCNANQYYIAHFDAGVNKLYYSVVDMALNSGLGDVTTKNILLGSNHTEALSCSHQLPNGCRWLFNCKVSSNKYEVIRFLVSDGAISAPVTLASVTINSPVYYNDLQLSADNKKLAISTAKNVTNVPDLYVWDLDLISGTLSNQQAYYLANSNPVFTIEFSPDGNKIYYRTNSASSNEQLGRLNLLTGLDTIIASNLSSYQSHLETAGNGRIYNSNTYSNYLAEIEFPDAANINNIGYSLLGIYVSGINIQHGMPHAIQGEPPGSTATPGYIAFSSTPTAICNEYQFIDTTCLGTQWWWDFGDSTFSEVEHPIHQYLSSDTFNVILKVLACADTLALSKTIITSSNLIASIVQSTDTLFASAGVGYQWYKDGNLIYGATNSFYVAIEEGDYTVFITDSNGCTDSETIFFSNLPHSGFNADDQFLCQKYCMNYTDQSTGNPISWVWYFEGGSPATSTEQNPQQICYNVPGTYDVMLITQNAFGTDTLIITDYIIVVPTPDNPIITQVGNVLTSSFATLYQWQFNSVDIPGATNQSYTATQTGYYTVVISDENGCISTSTIYVMVITGIEETGAGRFSIYPNPNKGEFLIEWKKGSNEPVYISIFNAIGQKIDCNLQLNLIHGLRTAINIDYLLPGFYWIELSTGKFLVRKKLVIE